MTSEDPLDDHDFRLIHPPDEATYGLWVDYDPNAVEPDPRVYPLWNDKGTVDAKELYKLVPMFSVMDDGPTVVFYSPDHIEGIYHRSKENLVKPDVQLEDLPYSKRPGIRLVGDRKIAVKEIGQLWNGNFVNGSHLISDKAPSASEYLSVDPSVLDPMRPSLSKDEKELQDAFGDYPWFSAGERSNSHLHTKHILKREVKWAPTLRGKKLLHEHSDFPPLTGDQLELLPHRVGVGTVALNHALVENADVSTYVSFPGDYNVDVVSEFPDGRVVLSEVVTAHRSMVLHLDTFRKLWDLSQRDPSYEPRIVFDSRTTLRWLLDYWTSKSGTDPGMSFNSEPQLDFLEEKFDEAYQNPNCNWEIADATTILRLWNETFGSEAPAYSRNDVSSVNW